MVLICDQVQVEEDHMWLLLRGRVMDWRQRRRGYVRARGLGGLPAVMSG